jgi:hypothetical protein
VVRRYDDTIDVRLTQVVGERGQAESSAAQPDAFVWRDRLYVVRAVQTRWYERRAWWREAAAAALLGLRGDEQQQGVGSSGAGSCGAGSSGGGTATEASAATGYLDGETEVWRVEAVAGRSGPVGVFDLARSVPAMPTLSGAAPSGWRLTRVAD